MKPAIHPEYHKVDAVCVCGNTIATGSTVTAISVEICEACHPFYTGQQKIVDTEGRVEKFKKRYEGRVIGEKPKKPVKVVKEEPKQEQPKAKKEKKAKKEAPKAEEPKAEAPKAEEAPKVEEAPQAVEAPQPEAAEAAPAEESKDENQ